MTEQQAIKIREVLVQGGETLSEVEISKVPEACQRMKYDESLISNGTRIYFPDTDKIYKNGSDVWDREEFNPVNAPELWTELNYRDGIRVIPESISYTERFPKDELGWWKDNLYRSLQNDNVYTPEQYASYWELVE